MTLPAVKLTELHLLLEQWLPSRQSATMKEVWQLTGKLWWASFAIRAGRHMVWRLTALTRGFGNKHVRGSQRISISAEAHEDITF